MTALLVIQGKIAMASYNISFVFEDLQSWAMVLILSSEIVAEFAQLPV